MAVNYGQLENRNGTIYNTATGKGYSDPTALASALGVNSSQIQWGNIRTASSVPTPPVAPAPVSSGYNPNGNLSAANLAAAQAPITPPLNPNSPQVVKAMQAPQQSLPTSSASSWQQINGAWTYAPNPVATPTPAPAVYSAAAAEKDYSANQVKLTNAEANIPAPQSTSTYQPTLIEISSARPDVLEQARAQGGDPYTAGTAANSWLNNWYNTTGKAEGADMVAKGILKAPTSVTINPTGNVALDSKISQINNTLAQPYSGSVIDAYNARPDVQAMIKNNYEGDPFTAGTPANTALNDWWNSTGKNEMAQSQSDAAAAVKAAEENITTAVANARLAEDGGDLIAFRASIKALEEAQTARQAQIDKLYEEQKTMRQSYLASLAPSATENDLNVQLADLSKQINQTELNRDAGIAKIDSQTIMQGFKTGQDAAVQKQANLALKTLNDSYNNLTARLNLATKSRETTTTALGAGLDFLTQDIATAQAAKNALDDEETKLIDRFDKYSDKQKADAAAVLEALAGVDPSKLSPQAQAQIATIASDLGIAPSDLTAALQSQYDQLTLEQIQKAKASTQVIEKDGRQVLINSDTGEVIKDLGVAPSSVSGQASVSEQINAAEAGYTVDNSGKIIPASDKSGGSLSWRNNNPGNIKYGDFAASFGATKGQAGTDGGSFAVFPDEATGRKAMVALLKSYGQKGLTLEQGMRRWSNSGYGAEIFKNTDGNKKIKDIPDSILQNLTYTMQKREGWTEGTVKSPAKQTAAEIKAGRVSSITNEMTQKSGSDGYVSAADYGRLIKANPDLRSLFPPQGWLNPAEPAAKMYFQSSTQAITPAKTTAAENDAAALQAWLDKN